MFLEHFPSPFYLKLIYIIISCQNLSDNISPTNFLIQAPLHFYHFSFQPTNKQKKLTCRLIIQYFTSLNYDELLSLSVLMFGQYKRLN